VPTVAASRGCDRSILAIFLEPGLSPREYRQKFEVVAMTVNPMNPSYCVIRCKSLEKRKLGLKLGHHVLLWCGGGGGGAGPPRDRRRGNKWGGGGGGGRG